MNHIAGAASVAVAKTHGTPLRDAFHSVAMDWVVMALIVVGIVLVLSGGLTGRSQTS